MSLRDEWRSVRDKEQQVTRASVFVHSNASWQDLSVVVTRTTVTDFEKIVDKLKVFFDEQFKSGECLGKSVER